MVKRRHAMTPLNQTSRGVFSGFWLRVYVREPGGKRMNVRIPIPLPLVGLLLPQEIDLKRAILLQEVLSRSPNPSLAVADFLDEWFPPVSFFCPTRLYFHLRPAKLNKK